MNNVRLRAERYAQAISQAVRNEEEFLAVRDDLHALAGMVEQSTALATALANPVLGSDKKANVVIALAQRVAARDVTLRFLRVLGQNDMLPALREVTRATAMLADRRAGIRGASVTSPAALDEGLRARVVSALERATSGKIRLSEKIDDELLGGLVVEIDGTVYDGSLKAQLGKLRERMLTGAAAV